MSYLVYSSWSYRPCVLVPALSEVPSVTANVIHFVGVSHLFPSASRCTIFPGTPLFSVIATAMFRLLLTTDTTKINVMPHSHLGNKAVAQTRIQEEHDYTNRALGVYFPRIVTSNEVCLYGHAWVARMFAFSAMLLADLPAGVELACSTKDRYTLSFWLVGACDLSPGHCCANKRTQTRVRTKP